jgi:hypothetical protein
MRRLTIFAMVLVLVLLITSGQTTGMSIVPGGGPAQQVAAGAAPLADGNVVYAASCAQGDVQAAVDVAQDGDTVIVPPGTCVWVTPGSMKPAVQIGKQTGWNPPTFESKMITLRGAGIGQTVIVDQTLHGYNESAILVFTVLGKSVRVTGFTIDRPGQKAEKGSINVNGTGQAWRIDHCEFINARRGNGIVASGDSYGVVDHCEFTTDSSPGGNFKAFAVMGAGDASWQSPLSLGTANAVYIEDCTLNYNISYRCFDADWGARWVFRHNTVYNNTDVGTHGYDSSPRSQISGEIYDNVFLHNSSGEYYTLMPFRGGTGVIFDNTVRHNVGQWNSFISLYYYCACPGHPTCGHETCTSYPCQDQPGRGPDSDGDDVQELEPIYEWNNVVDIAGLHIAVADLCPQAHTFIQENRDYYINTPRPGYTPYTYPHPLTQDLVLTGTAASGAIGLAWEVTTAFPYPQNTTWQIGYTAPNGTAAIAATGLVSATRAYTVTGLTENTPYTVTLSGMVDVPGGDPLSWASATAVVTPTGLTLRGRPGNTEIYLDWEITPAPPSPTTTWRIDYYTQTVTTPFTATDPLSATRSCVLTENVQNYQWYTVTLHAMANSTSILSDTVRVMPTDVFVYLPLIMRGATR